jgi:predicted ABC-type transport system involved in lysophospholipase L1 biosynthesis ATPase subunit
MNILGCLDTPTKGEYILNGINVSQMTDNELAEVRNKEIGFVFQTFNLLPRSTALDNVALPLIYAGANKKERDQRATKALENVGLGNRVTHKPNELSGGQRQRVAVARALINNPSIIALTSSGNFLDLFIFKHIYIIIFTTIPKFHSHLFRLFFCLEYPKYYPIGFTTMLWDYLIYGELFFILTYKIVIFSFLV